MPNVLSPRDLISRPDNMDETVPHYKGFIHHNVWYEFHTIGDDRPDMTIAVKWDVKQHKNKTNKALYVPRSNINPN